MGKSGLFWDMPAGVRLSVSAAENSAEVMKEVALLKS